MPADFGIGCVPSLFDGIRQRANLGATHLLAVGLSRSGLAPDDGWRLLAAGASDVLWLPELSDPPAMVAARFGRWAEVDRLLASPLVAKNLVGESPRLALAEVVEAARFGDSGVLLLGESGTGKELVARLIHTLDTASSSAAKLLLLLGGERALAGPGFVLALEIALEGKLVIPGLVLAEGLTVLLILRLVEALGSLRPAEPNATIVARPRRGTLEERCNLRHMVALVLSMAIPFGGCCDCKTRPTEQLSAYMGSRETGPRKVSIENEANASAEDARQTREFLESLPAACNGSRAFAARDGIVRIHVQCSGESHSMSGIVQIKNGVVTEIQ